MDFNDLTEEQKRKARAVSTPEEMLALAREEGYELSDNELEAVSGGGAWSSGCSGDSCPSHDYCPSQCSRHSCSILGK